MWPDQKYVGDKYIELSELFHKKEAVTKQLYNRDE